MNESKNIKTTIFVVSYSSFNFKKLPAKQFFGGPEDLLTFQALNFKEDDLCHVDGHLLGSLQFKRASHGASRLPLTR
jgi:hypothetical protein